MKVFVSLFIILILCIPIDLYAQNQSRQNENELLAAQYMRDGDFAKAVVIYEELFEENPGPVIYNNYLVCLLELNEFRKAERAVTQQIRNNPGSYRYEVDLGYVYNRSGDNRRARRHLEGLIQNVTAQPVSFTDLANAFLFREFYDYALQTYQKGRNIFRNTYPFNLQIASIHEKRGNISDMMREYVDLVAIDISYLDNVQAILQDALNDDPEFIKADALRMVLLQRSQESSAQVIYAELLLWLSIQQKDFPMALRQARAIDRRLRQEGELVLDVARLSASNNDFPSSKQGFEYIIERGDLNPYYMEARAGLLNVKYQEATSGYNINIPLLKEVEAEYQSMIDQMGVIPQTVSLIRNMANLKAFYLGKPGEAIDLLNQIIAMPNISNRIKAECRIELADILVLQGQLWDAHLIYALVDRTFRDDPLAHEARFKNARLSFYMGEFKWAKAQLDVLKSATSRLIANDAMALSLLIQDNLDENDQSEPLEFFARAQKHAFMNNFDLALNVLDSLQLKFPSHQINDDVLLERAKIYKRTGRYDEADKMLARITETFPNGILAAQALFERAQLHEEIFSNADEAMNLYQQLVVNYPGTIYTVTARNKFRQLRGDLVN
jgi:tetratricopeptide (TPR) repeat protein